MTDQKRTAAWLIHELRNSAALILNYSELMGPAVTEQGRDDLEEIKKAAERIRALCDELESA